MLVRTRLLALAGPAVAASLLLSCVTASAESGPWSSGVVLDRPQGTQGAPGAGDPYFPLDGNGGYDVVHHDIADSYDVPTDQLSGSTTVTATATQDLTRFDLDTVLTVSAVEVDGVSASYTQQPHELVVSPAQEILDGSRFTVEVSYAGVPHTISYGGERPWSWNHHEGVAMNEPHVAPWWFAADDYPTDKATYDVTVQVPKGDQVVSNGTLVSHTSDADYSTWHWRMDEPISSYLAYFAAGSFAVRTGVRDGLPYTIAASTNLDDVPAALDLLRQTPDIVAWEESKFGPYPFDSTGGVMTSIDTGFSLENASRPTYSPYADVGTVVHEIAHQWFGDDVSVHRWSDIWLNEGFARFTEWLYDEDHGGLTTQQSLLSYYNFYGHRSAFWSRLIADPGPEHLFGDPVYFRGAMTVAALRHRIGDDDFFTLLRTWVAGHAEGNASTADFVALAEQVSGQDLSGFFQAWLYTPRKPAETKGNGLV